MALTVAGRGANSNKTGGTSFNVVPTANFAVDSLAELVLAVDNAATSGADPIVSVTDNGGNTWTRRQTQTKTPGSVANDGAVSSIWTCRVVSLLTTNTITVSFGSTTVTAKVWALIEHAAGAGKLASYKTGGGTTGSGTAFTMTTGSITSGDTLACAIAVEDASDGANDADTTNGSWSQSQASFTGAAGGGVGNMGMREQCKIVTGTATQTWNFTVANTDWAATWIEVEEINATLVVADGAHSHLADNVTMTQAHTLVVADGAHAHTADNLVLSSAGGPDTYSDTYIDAYEAPAANSLVVADGTHAHTADNVTFVGGAATLVVADGLHAHTADRVVLQTVSPTVVTNNLWRRVNGDTGEGIRVAVLEPNGSHLDWLVANRKEYQYRAEAVAVNGTSSFSDWT